MEYRSVNEPQNFYYHDSYLDSIEFLSADMILTVSLNNVEPDNSQNDTGTALQVNAMRITFADYRIKGSKKYGSKTFDSNKNIIQETPDIPLAPRDAEKLFELLSKEDNPCSKIMYGNGSCCEGTVTFEVEFFAAEQYLYLVELECSSFIAEWDEFNGYAWYKNRKQIKTPHR